MRWMGLLCALWLGTAPCVAGLDSIITSALNLSDEAIQMAQMAKTLSDLKAITQTQSAAIKYIQEVYQDTQEGEMFFDKADDMFGKENSPLFFELSDISRTLSNYIGIDLVNTPLQYVQDWIDSKFINPNKDIVQFSENTVKKLDSINEMRTIIHTLSDEGKENHNAKNSNLQTLNSIQITEYQRNIANDLKKLYSLQLKKEVEEEARNEANKPTTNMETFEKDIWGMFR